MKILGIDFGQRKIGLAITEGFLAEPLGIIEIKNCPTKRDLASPEQLGISRICQEQDIEKIVIGLPEGRLAAKVEKFASQLGKLTDLPVEFQDETLTSQEAVAKMREIGKKLKDEDAIAAALILQGYLDRKDNV